jgi:hypothetical protein
MRNNAITTHFPRHPVSTGHRAKPNGRRKGALIPTECGRLNQRSAVFTASANYESGPQEGHVT